MKNGLCKQFVNINYRREYNDKSIVRSVASLVETPINMIKNSPPREEKITHRILIGDALR